MFALPDKKTLSVTQLTMLIKGHLEKEFSIISVLGEISNLRRQSSGHCYFSLKDDSALLSAVLFRGNAARVSFPLRDGISVVATGEISVYEARGQYQMIVRSMQPSGEGDLQARFEALKKKLQAEGLFSAEKKRPLPRHPRTIVVITSLTAAALRDFRQVIGRRAPQVRLLIMPVPVQGKEAAPSICRALSQLNDWVKKNLVSADAVALIRGGGSLEDLWTFNEESVARALASSLLPTISGVGHETDVTIGDLVADLRAPTPSAAAELLSANHAELRDQITQLSGRLSFIVNSRFTYYSQNIERLASCQILQRPMRIVEKMSQLLDDRTNTFFRSLRIAFLGKQQVLNQLTHKFDLCHPRHALRAHTDSLKNLSNRLTLLDPRNALRLGYAWVKNSDGTLLRSPEQVEDGDNLTISLRDGVLHAKVCKNPNSPSL